MYSYGVEGDEGVLEQQVFHDMNSQRMFDSTEPSPRGEEHTMFVAPFATAMMRTGMTLKLLSFTFMGLFFLGFGGRWVFTYHSHPDLSPGFHLTMVILLIFGFLGSMCLTSFQAFVADDSKWSKGFRTGSKILSAAITLDVLATVMRIVQYLYLFNYLGSAWWSRYTVSKSEWMIFAVHNVLDGFSLMLYGWAYFYMEVYHDEGTLEEAAWSIVTLYTLAGFFMIAMVFTGFGALFIEIFTLAALGMGTWWSFAFEPLLEKWSPELHSRDINTDIMPAVNGGDFDEGIYMSGEGMNKEDVGVITHPDAVPNMSSMGMDIPTSYDYTQLQNQVSQGLEMGVVNHPYH